MRETILTKLRALEREHNIAVLYACESGSRAWGTHTPASDYDLRFLYVRPMSFYMSIRPKQMDVIAQELDGKLDVVGYDLRKALQMLRGSGAALLELLVSPVVYYRNGNAAGDLIDKMFDLAKMYASSQACMYQYHSMCLAAMGKYSKTRSIKQILYAARAVLAMRYLERHGALVPLAFQELLAGALDDEGQEGRLADSILKLVEDRRNGRDADESPHLTDVQHFIHGHIERHKTTKLPREHAMAFPVEVLDSLFYETVLQTSKQNGYFPCL